MALFTRQGRMTTLSAAAIGALLLTSCGDDGEGSDADDGGDEAPSMALIFYPQFLDGSWGEAGLTGAEQLEEEGAISELATQEDVPPGSEAINALTDFAEEGYDVVIAHSFDYGDDVKQVAEDYPDTLFVYAGGFGDVEGNVGDYAQPFYEPSYLMGILSAGTEEEGDVGGAGGFDIPVCLGMYNSFLDGAQEVREDVEGSFVAVGDWDDLQLASETAQAQADAGATMFIGCGQGPTFGQIETADSQGTTANGYTGDMSDRSDQVLASFEWNLAEVFRLMVEDVEGGFDGEADYYEAGYADGAMTVVINPEREDDIAPDALELFEQREEEILNGEYEVEFSGE